MNDRPDNVELLTQRLAELERRVYVLEHPTEAPPPLTLPEQAEPAAPQPAVVQQGIQTAGAFAVLGKAMLAIAGAYLLRAIAESSLLPRHLAATIAIAYAILWLVAAARVPSEAWFASATYACTSGIMLAPMLWELTLRFNVLPASAAAGTLAIFFGVAFALNWKHDQRAVLWAATITAAAVAVSLSIASHQMLPFVAVLLLMVAFSEFAATLGHTSGTRVVAAFAADVALWVQIYIYSSPRGAHPDYPSTGTLALLVPSLVLFVLFAAGTTRTTVMKRETISTFETIQAMAAFLLAACAWLYFGPANSPLVLGIFSLLLSAACYAAASFLFERDTARRNARVYSLWSVALFLAGSMLCLPAPWQGVWLSLAALATIVLEEKLTRPALAWHSFTYVCAAALVSGLPTYIYGALVGSLPAQSAGAVYFAVASAILCSMLFTPHPDDVWTRQLLHLAFAALAVGSLAAVLAQGLTALVALRLIPAAHHLALIRTLTLCVAALGLAFGGVRLGRREMTRLSYAVLVLVAAKLIFEDLHNGRLEYTAASIFLFAVTLIAVSRTARQS